MNEKDLCEEDREVIKYFRMRLQYSRLKKGRKPKYAATVAGERWTLGVVKPHIVKLLPATHEKVFGLSADQLSRLMKAWDAGEITLG